MAQRAGAPGKAAGDGTAGVLPVSYPGGWAEAQSRAKALDYRARGYPLPPLAGLGRLEWGTRHGSG